VKSAQREYRLDISRKVVTPLSHKDVGTFKVISTSPEPKSAVLCKSREVSRPCKWRRQEILGTVVHPLVPGP